MRTQMGFSWLKLLSVLSTLYFAAAENPVTYFDWTVSYITIQPLGVKQKVIGINGIFPGPVLNTTTNRMNMVNVQNDLDEAFLLTWDGIQQRRNAWMDGVAGTNCPIPAGQNFTFNVTAKDQIGSYFYWPTTLFQRAAGGYGSVRVSPRAASGVRVPFGPPDNDIIVMIGDWYIRDHKSLRASVDNGIDLGMPDGVLINGKGPYNRTSNYETIIVKQGSVVRFRVTNAGISTALNFRIQGHQMQLVEAEGSYTVQQPYDSLDIFVGQSYSFLLNCTGNLSDYYIVASPRFVDNETLWANITGIGVLHYYGSKSLVSGPLPDGPSMFDKDFSLNQARNIRRNLTTGAARPNPQGSFHYGDINVTDYYHFDPSEVTVKGKRRYAVNGISFLQPDTPILLADQYKLKNVYTLVEKAQSASPLLQTTVLNFTYQGYIEMVFQNFNNFTAESWHVDGYAAFIVGYGTIPWTEDSRGTYNKWDAMSRSSFQVYPNSWTAIQISLDNVGLWNLRSENLIHNYLGQELYFKVNDPEDNIKNTAYAMPDNVLYCGQLQKYAKASSNHKSTASAAVGLIFNIFLAIMSVGFAIIWVH